MKNAIKLARLFNKNSTKNGKPYLVGRLNGSSRLLVLPVDKTKDPDGGDWTLFLVQVEPQDQQQQGGGKNV